MRSRFRYVRDFSGAGVLGAFLGSMVDVCSRIIQGGIQNSFSSL